MLKKSMLLAALLFASVAPFASELPEYPFIHVGGSAAQYVMPDLGEIDFEVIAVNADPALARATVEERVAQIQALVQEQGLPVEDVMVQDTRQTIRKGEGTDAAPVYQVKSGIHLNVRDLSKWQAIAGGLLGLPNLDSFAIDFSPKDKNEVDAMLANEAIKDARKRAETIAAGFGRKLGPVMAVTTGQLKNLTNALGLFPSDFLMRPRANTSSAKRTDRADIVNISPQRYSQSVDVIFRIK